MSAQEVLSYLSIALLSFCAILFVFSMVSAKVRGHKRTEQSYSILVMIAAMCLAVREYLDNQAK